MRIDHRFRDCKPETKAAKTAGDRGLTLFEGVEDFIDLLRFDPDAGIGDSDFNLLGGRRVRYNKDAAFLRCELNAVLDQIRQDKARLERFGGGLATGAG